MRFNKDYFDNPIAPEFILCKANQEKIAVLNCTAKSYDRKYKDIDEISFQISLYDENMQENNGYDLIDVMRYILVPDIGFFSIIDIDISSEGTKYETKTVSCKSYENILSQKYLEEFTINMGTVESIDAVRFYDLGDKSHSLLHLILNEKAPEWELGHIDTPLITMQRSFEIDRQDVYSFLMNDVAEAFGCIFIFDTIHKKIHAYLEDNISRNTNIFVSYDNLIKSTNIKSSTDNIKTALRLTGSNDVDVRRINLGYDVIYNFEPYNSTDYWSQGLYDAYNAWIILRNTKLPDYKLKLDSYNQKLYEINYLTYEKMPQNPESTEWAEYGLNPLKEKLAAFEQQQAVQIKMGHGSPSNQFYESDYLPLYNKIVAVTNQISTVEGELNNLRTEQKVYADAMVEIQDRIAMENNFTENQLKELSSFIREDELSSDNYVITDTMSDEEQIEMLEDLLSFGEKELQWLSMPEISFDASLSNLFSIPEFEPFYDDMDVGNYITISLRDNFSVKTTITSIHINFYDMSDFSVTFNSVVKRSKDKYSDLSTALKAANSAATSVSFNRSYWTQAARDTDNINRMLTDGLEEAGASLKSGVDSETLFDNRGIFVTTKTGEGANEDAIFIGNGRILFTDDNWKTVREAIGRITINDETTFGVLAQAVVAGYIAGSTITGSIFNNGNGTFQVDASGKLTASDVHINGGELNIGKDQNQQTVFKVDSSGNLTARSATITGNIVGGTITIGQNFSVNDQGKMQAANAVLSGQITATSGYIGTEEDGFVITSKSIYNGKLSLNNDENGIYIGTDGIALGVGKTEDFTSAFSVTKNGVLIASSGSIGGVIIDGGNGLKASNGNWSISSNGTAVFKNVTITGVQKGSSFGELEYTSKGITQGNFGGASYFKPTVDNPFGTNSKAVTQIETLAVNKVKAEYIEAITARISTIENDYITTEKLNAHEINASKIKSGTMDIKYLSTGGKSARWGRVWLPTEKVSGVSCTQCYALIYYEGE